VRQPPPRQAQSALKVARVEYYCDNCELAITAFRVPAGESAGERGPGTDGALLNLDGDLIDRPERRRRAALKR
jgi:hypothetical protein